MLNLLITLLCFSQAVILRDETNPSSVAAVTEGPGRRRKRPPLATCKKAAGAGEAEAEPKWSAGNDG